MHSPSDTRTSCTVSAHGMTFRYLCQCLTYMLRNGRHADTDEGNDSVLSDPWGEYGSADDGNNQGQTSTAADTAGVRWSTTVDAWVPSGNLPDAPGIPYPADEKCKEWALRRLTGDDLIRDPVTNTPTRNERGMLIGPPATANACAACGSVEGEIVYSVNDALLTIYTLCGPVARRLCVYKCTACKHVSFWSPPSECIHMVEGKLIGGKYCSAVFFFCATPVSYHNVLLLKGVMRLCIATLSTLLELMGNSVASQCTWATLELTWIGIHIQRTSLFRGQIDDGARSCNQVWHL